MIQYRAIRYFLRGPYLQIEVKTDGQAPYTKQTWYMIHVQYDVDGDQIIN